MCGGVSSRGRFRKVPGKFRRFRRVPVCAGGEFQGFGRFSLGVVCCLATLTGTAM